MSIQKPEPYDINGAEDPFGPSGHVEIISPQGETDNRARSTRMDAIALEPGRMCVSCGYDLTGLFVGGNCPECGDKILSFAPSPDIEALKKMPQWYLRSIGAVLLMMGILGGLGVVIAVILWASPSGATPGFFTSIPLLAVSLAWLACVVFICIPPPEHEPVTGIGRSRPELVLATVAIVSQFGFVVSALLPTVAPNAGWIAWPALVSYGGMALVGFQLAKVSWRLNDVDRARRLQSAAISILFGYGLTFFFGQIVGAHVPALSLFGVPFLFMQVVGLVLQAWGCVYLVWSLWSLSREADWAIRNARAAEARIERMKQRAKENYEQTQSEREASQPFGGPIP